MNSITQTNNQNYALRLFKQGFLLFWFFWFLIACLSNSTDFLIAKNMIHAVSFHSGNYFLLKKVLGIYNNPTQLLDLLFSLDIIAQGVSAILFLIASYSFWKGTNYWPSINIAFGFSIFLWSIFIILEEVFIAYSYEGTHVRLFVFELIGLMAMHILPHGNNNPL